MSKVQGEYTGCEVTGVGFQTASPAGNGIEIGKGRAEAKGQELAARLASSFAFDRRLIEFQLYIHKTEHLLPTCKEEVVS